ncbi:peptide/nickel transport system substrate-binding protein [Cohaesibacter sp. ES.047]|uniref:ABC transporter substrate-binding protein n=1 Tax=Cohaesibacter sp. ES.047 TaxID=1798205 RepID=UPI000BB6FC4E|nr:ABC transporter substrate-binding protein [Cohaesibacter sp. ES.047]SNY93150.1 peptide/nickel transport system substrate-binding protein [Cohaesibacter sp. ES.047]
MLFSKTSFIQASLIAVGIIGAATAWAAEPIEVGQTYLTRGVEPTKGSNGWALVSHGIGENLFSVDEKGALVPQLANDAKRTGDLTWEIELAPGNFFSDGSAVDAKTLAAGFEEVFADNKAALATGGKLSFEALADLTLKVTTEKPVPRIQALFAEWPLIAFKPTGDGQAVFSGPYAVTSFKADSDIELVPNAYYEGAENRSPVTIHKFGDAQAMTLALESGELDLAFGLPSETVSRLNSNPDLTVKSFPVGYQYFAWLNTTRPALSDKRVRQALDLTFDRKELVAAINGGLPAIGAYAPYFPFAAKQARPTDLEKAASLLEEAGWVKGSDGVRTKDGVALTLLALTYPQRPDLVTMLPVVKAELARVGIALETRIVDNISQVVGEGEYDIALWAQHTAPSGDPAFFLNSMLATGASMNHAKYSSKAFDAIVAKFASESDANNRNALALEAQTQLFEDVPISFLVSPVWYAGMSKRLENYQPWGSDYHVLRADIGE